MHVKPGWVLVCRVRGSVETLFILSVEEAEIHPDVCGMLVRGIQQVNDESPKFSEFAVMPTNELDPLGWHEIWMLPCK
jgi:hypothetical protein